MRIPSDCSCVLGLAGHGQEELELGRELVLGVESVGEVDSSDSAVRVDLYSQGLDIVGTVGSPREIGQVELNLVPSLVESHGHGTDEGFDPGSRLVVGGSESTPHALVVEDLDLEREVLLQVLNDHNQEGQLDSQSLLGVERGIDVVGRHISSHDLKDGGLDIWVGDSLNVAVSHLLVPDLEGLRSVIKYLTVSCYLNILLLLTRWSRG